MKKLKSKIILITLVILIVMVFLFQIQKNQNFNSQEEFIFFKLFSFHQKENSDTFLSEKQESSSYDFEVAYQNIDFKDIYLVDTMQRNSLRQEKIAPGTQGEFTILLKSNKKINYRIQFKSTNEKPENLYFQIKGSDRKYKKLEDMEENLKGELLGNKRISIYWKWEYEGEEEENKQDTKDGQTMIKYQFTIFAIGQ